MTPDQHADIVLFWAMVTIVCIVLIAYAVRAIARFYARLAPVDYVEQPEQPTPEKADTEAVHVPILSTDTEASTSPKEDDITEDVGDMPRIGRRLSDAEIVIFLATQKGEDGAKYRFSANQIYELVKGPRAGWLDLIRETRSGPPAPQVREHQARLEQLQAATNE